RRKNKKAPRASANLHQGAIVKNYKTIKCMVFIRFIDHSIPVIMRGSFIALMITLLSLQLVHSHPGRAQGILNRKISIQANNMSLAEVLAKVQEETGLEFLFSSRINSQEEVNLDIRNERVKTALNRLLHPA